MLGFVGCLAMSLQPSSPEARLPAEYRLNALIDRQGQENTQQRDEVRRLNEQVQIQRSANQRQRTGASADDDAIKTASAQAGVAAVTGKGFVATLNDSSLSRNDAGTKNLNDLVIHSQDLQSVVNAMWAARAEAVSVNNQRIVATSAVLCVGNTLLINGTVHAPPFEVRAIGADRAVFDADEGIRQLSRDAERYGLGFSVSKTQDLMLPAYDGSRLVKYAKAETRP